jgi:hypothetical protein
VFRSGTPGAKTKIRLQFQISKLWRSRLSVIVSQEADDVLFHVVTMML